MKRIQLVTVVLCLFCIGNVNTGFSQSLIFSFQSYTNGKGDTLNYWQLYPDSDTLRKYPLVIFLHGSGERGNDNEAQLKWGVMNFATDQNMIKYKAIVIAPQCPEKMSWANFSNKKDSREKLLLPVPSKPMELLIALIHQLIKKLPVDTNRIYITGLSMGGHGTYDAIERYPDLFAAAVPVCGGGDVTRAASIAHIPIWIFAGAEDAAVNPLYSLDMLEALSEAGAHPGFTQYPEVGHFSWLGAYSDPLMMEWLFRQHK
ncbi:MAG: prolyl oligopeptidase family serine peptidase [Ginsengibacter sp.]